MTDHLKIVREALDRIDDRWEGDDRITNYTQDIETAVVSLLAERDEAVAALREIASDEGWHKEGHMCFDIAHAALARLSTPKEPTVHHTLSGSFCSECQERLDYGGHEEGCSALGP